MAKTLAARVRANERKAAKIEKTLADKAALKKSQDKLDSAKKKLQKYK